MPLSPPGPRREPIDHETLVKALEGHRAAMQQVIDAMSVVVARVLSSRLLHVEEARRPELRRRCLLGAWGCLVDEAHAVLGQWDGVSVPFDQFVLDAVSTWIDGIDLPTLSVHDWKPELVCTALDNPGPLRRQLASYVLEHIRCAAIRVLQSYRRQVDVAAEAEDLIQAFVVKLLEKDGKILRGWNPALGRKLSSYLYLIGRRYIFTQLRKQHRHDGKLVPNGDERVRTVTAGADDFEKKLREELALQMLRSRLDVNELRLLDLLCSDASAKEGAEVLGITENNFYQRKHRLSKKIEALGAELIDDD